MCYIHSPIRPEVVYSPPKQTNYVEQSLQWDDSAIDYDGVVVAQNTITIKRTFSEPQIISSLPILGNSETGKFYFEIEIVEVDENSDARIGIDQIQSTMVASGYKTISQNALLCSNTQAIFFNTFNGAPNSGAAPRPARAGDIVRIAIDTSSNLAWIGHNAQWYGVFVYPADPETGVGGGTVFGDAIGRAVSISTTESDITARFPKKILKCRIPNGFEVVGAPVALTFNGINLIDSEGNDLYI